MFAELTRKQWGWIALSSALCAGAVYGCMIGITLARLEAISGLVPFDMRPMGYDPTGAAALLAALGEEGRAYYITRQLPLDTVYPALLAMTLTSANVWLGWGLSLRWLVIAGSLLSIGAAGADYAENIGIRLMLGAAQPPVGLVEAASTASVTKAVLTTLAAFVTLAIMCLRLLTSLRSGLRGVAS